jgi:2-(1,2-epoxy-1,2-dihydrophenyl)acetyl-CoA isomerase
MVFDCIRFDVSDSIATLTLDRPDKLNSFTETMLREIRAGVDEASRSEAVRVLVMTGSGRAFSAGQDLSEITDKPGVELRSLLDELYNPLIRAIRGLEKPVVASVNGIAAGAGANLALAADIVLAARSAGFIQAFSKIGLVPDSGGSHVLPRLVGRARALGLTLLGEPVSAETAEAWGLIWACVDDDRLEEETAALARRLADGPTAALGLIKRAIDAAATNDLDRQLDLERDYQQTASQTEDYREGVQAFLEKRPPRFRGK